MLNPRGQLGVWRQEKNELRLHYSSILAPQWKILEERERNTTSWQIWTVHLVIYPW